ncbi:hypothetical protein Tdes44962_MAKER09826 [Teratosphaeria destructans]|uniref:Uncharacterized protein n=1 Tax=Teratosphaeria destructans TaxID=418781 RepID=A0A9W7SRB8_9PEZI|nr:hypothetical protein Tdes44962_MAKER09826 [Teratosphaeria destructans]
MPATGMNRNTSNKALSPTAPTPRKILLTFSHVSTINNSDPILAQKKSRRSALTRNACLQCRQAKTKVSEEHEAEHHHIGRHTDNGIEGITKMQSLQQKLDDSNTTLDLVMTVIGKLQSSSDVEASNILARLRLGENIMDIGAALIQEGNVQIPNYQVSRHQVNGRMQHLPAYKRYSSSSGSSDEVNRSQVLQTLHDQELSHFNAQPVHDWPPSPESANTSFSSGVTSTSQVGPMESSYLSAPLCEFDWPQQQQNLFVASMSGAPPLITAPMPGHQVVSAPPTPMSEGPYRQAPPPSYPRAVLPSNAPIQGSPMRAQVGMPVHDDMDMINSARMMAGRADSVHEIPVIMEPPKLRSVNANIAAHQHNVRSKTAKQMVPEYMWSSGSEDGFAGMSYPPRY